MATETSDELRAQWARPNDVFSFLLIVGGDVIQLALANLTGYFVTPISFSFGWVTYAITAVLGMMGNRRLINCPPETPVKVINLKSRYARDNHSWLLGRLVKTYDSWMPSEVRDRIGRGRRKREASANPCLPFPEYDKNIALCVAVYTWGSDPGKPSLDWVWWTGVFVTAVQLGIAAIPFSMKGNWAIFMAVVAGTVLAYSSASLPYWRKEKYQARRAQMGNHIALTRGQGSQHVLIVMNTKVDNTADGNYAGLNLEDLAAGRAPDIRWPTRILTAILGALWLVFLITCQGIRTDTWYLLAVGGLGMLHNLFVAGWPRRPAAIGLPLVLYTGENKDRPHVFVEEKVMWALMELEMEYTGFGRALLQEFFPGPILDWEEEWWQDEDQDRRGILDNKKRDYESRKRSGQAGSRCPS